MKTYKNMESKFIDKVKSRRNKLLDMMRNSTQPVDVYTMFKHKPRKLESFLEEIQSEVDQHPESAFCPKEFDPENRRICFQGKRQSQVIYADYLAFHFFDLYVANKTTVERYVHFEIYFEDSLLSVLMKKSAYNARNRIFSEFDLDFQEWAQLKLQMEMWNQWYRPIIKTIRTDKIDDHQLMDFFITGNFKNLSNKKRIHYWHCLARRTRHGNCLHGLSRFK